MFFDIIEKVETLIMKDIKKSLTVYFFVLFLFCFILFFGAYYNPNHYVNQEVNKNQKNIKKFAPGDTGIYRIYNQI